MKSGTSNSRGCLSLAVGLFVLAGICFGAGPAFAQFDCPLPAGLTPPADPGVTARDVEDGSGSLMDFTLLVRGLYAGADQLTADEEAYFACLVRQDGSAWHSGSTYIVRLETSGRVSLHTKDMSLSGRQLDPMIYRAILDALGIDPAELSDRATALAAFTALADGDGAPFNVPGIPGASGYVTVWVQSDVGNVNLLITGFDLDPSHLAEEVIQHVEPDVTASDVVDRETLKAFVTGAGQYLASLIESEGLGAFAGVKSALRDPDGPWRDGPVYLALLRLDSNVIQFHGAFPDRFELRQGGISRDIATGERVVDQLVAAAESDLEEGGFWLYYFDNPADDTDSADTPKIGYARIITANIPGPGGRTATRQLIINSGFYLTPDSVFVQRILGALKDGDMSMLFGIDTPADGDIVAGDDVTISVTGAPTDTVHFAHRPAGLADAEYTYLGAATNRGGGASFTWNTTGLRDDDYELVALYTEDEGHNVVYDSIEVNIDNVGDGGCAAVPVLPGGGGPMDPTLTVLVGLLMLYLLLGRRRPMRQPALG